MFDHVTNPPFLAMATPGARPPLGMRTCVVQWLLLLDLDVRDFSKNLFVLVQRLWLAVWSLDFSD